LKHIPFNTNDKISLTSLISARALRILKKKKGNAAQLAWVTSLEDRGSSAREEWNGLTAGSLHVDVARETKHVGFKPFKKNFILII
jgi:hypothetical protein